MIAHRQPTPQELLQEAEPVTAAAQEAVREVLSVHKRLGQSIAVWRDGRVVIVPPEEIEVELPTTNGDSASAAS
jgi:hypothetical protein